jgi:phosphatidylserine decarboxylase
MSNSPENTLDQTTPPPDLFAVVVLLAHLLPKNILSYLTGLLVRVKLPKGAANWLNKGFVALFKIDMSEALMPLETFDCIESVFVRKLKEGERKIESDLCSPADGFLAHSAKLIEGQAIQAKGLYYKASDLVFGESAEPHNTSFKWFTTIYLAPHNYHRVHSPISGEITCIRHLPGELWPVNTPFVKRLPRLFVRNERLCFDILMSNGGFVHVVMVGAFNVGRVETKHLPQVVTNSWARQFGISPKSYPQETPIKIDAGDELGTFMLGSTVVLVFDEKAAETFALKEETGNNPIKLGRTLLNND